MIKRSHLLLLVFLLIFEKYSCLKIKIESLKILKTTRKAQAESLVVHLSKHGPFDLLAEFLKLESFDFRTFAVSNCYQMKTLQILKIIKDFEVGNLTFEQFKLILSAECLSKWTKRVWEELIECGAFNRLPTNPLEAYNFNVQNLPAEDFLNVLKVAWNSPDREKMYWNGWTSTASLTQIDKIFGNPMWKEQQFLWQSINFRNFLLITESKLMLRFNLMKFIGSIDSIEAQNLDELVQRSYTLLSFVKVAEMDYQNCVIRSGNSEEPDALLKGILVRIVSANMGLFVKLKNRIKELDEAAAQKLTSIFDFCMLEPAQQEGQVDKVNEIFKDFLSYTETIQIGDWMIGIFCILSDHVKLLSIENVSKFLEKFFAKRPSIYSVSIVFKFLKGKWPNKARADEILSEHLRDKPVYLIHLYRNHRNLLSNEFVYSLPIRLRFIENLKNRLLPFTASSKRFLEFKMLRNPILSSLRRIVSMILTIGWTKININHGVIVLRADDSVEFCSIENIIREYFSLFLEQQLFYEIVEYDQMDDRPIIRILPVFPVEMWHQIAHLMTRALLLNIRIPFILDSEFFKSIFDLDLTLLSKMSSRIDLFTNNQVKDLYSFIRQDIDLNPLILPEKLMELCFKIEELKISKNPRGLVSTRSFEFVSTEQPKLLRIHSSGVLPESNRQFVSTYDMISVGMKSFYKGLNFGFNIGDFTIEEAHKILFYSGK